LRDRVEVDRIQGYHIVVALLSGGPVEAARTGPQTAVSDCGDVAHMGNVMLVEDDPDYAALVQSVLVGEGYEVAVAHTVGAAREVLRRRQPDLVLLDVLLPDEDGLSLAREMARDDRLSDIPVLLLTCVAENVGTVMDAFESGEMLTVADVLRKSDFPQGVLAAIRSALASRAGGKESDA
jgi:DNA-binding response OmpR family regulator